MVRDVPIPVDEYRREMIERVLREATNLNDFRQLWIESPKRRRFIDHLVGDNFSPEHLREIEQMTDYDMYDLFAHYGYRARALNRHERKVLYLADNLIWFDAMDLRAATVLRGSGQSVRTGRNGSVGDTCSMGCARDQVRWRSRSAKNLVHRQP